MRHPRFTVVGMTAIVAVGISFSRQRPGGADAAPRTSWGMPRPARHLVDCDGDAAPNARGRR